MSANAIILLLLSIFLGLVYGYILTIFYINKLYIPLALKYIKYGFYITFF